MPPILEACLATAEADPPLGSRLAGFLSDRPVAQIKPNIVPKIGDQPWANSVFEKWEKSAGLVSSSQNGNKTAEGQMGTSAI